MTLLGKIFTALILIASLVCVTVAVMVNASHQNWVKVAKENQEKYQSLLATYQAALDQREELERAIERERIARAMAIAQLQIKVEQRTAEVLQKEAQLAAETQKSQESLTRLRDSLARLQELETQLKDLRAENIALRTDLHEEVTQVVALTDQTRQMDAKLVGAEERFSQLTNELAQMSKVIFANGLDIYASTDGTPPPVDGRITRVSSNIKGLVEINLGADDGIRKGHELNVYRGGEFLGRVRVTETDNNHAVGTLLNDLTRGPIKEDDRVTTKLGG